MKLKLNQNIKFSGKVFNKDTIIEVDVDANNVPLEQFWRRRLKDSLIDNCVEVVKESKEEIEQSKKNINKKTK